jgi:hypothetical protein
VTEDEARKVAEMLKQAGLPGEAGPVSPSEPTGAWCIWHDGQDVTRASLDALIEQRGGDRTEPGWHNGRPVRGFVFPATGRA